MKCEVLLTFAQDDYSKTEGILFIRQCNQEERVYTTEPEKEEEIQFMAAGRK